MSKRKSAYIEMMDGIGDCLYLRPFIKILARTEDVYLRTALPSMFKDIPNVFFTQPREQTYRTQAKARDHAPFISELPEDHYMILPHYGKNQLLVDSVVATFYKQFDIPFTEELEWSLPDFRMEYLTAVQLHQLDIPTYGRKIAVIRPTTIRKEWEVTSRGPNPNYVPYCCKLLREAGYFTISIADTEKEKEWIDGNIMPVADLTLHKGELGIYGTLELIKMADIVITGSNFVVPAAISAGVPTFVIFGGRGMYDSPYKLFHPSMDLRRLGWAIPKNFCKCTNMLHNCDKTISDLDTKLYEFLGRIALLPNEDE